MMSSQKYLFRNKKMHYFLLPIVLSLIVLANAELEWNTRDFFKREHSLSKPYQGSGMTIPFWDFQGSTIVTADYIRLTPDLQSKTGALWNTVPVSAANWEFHTHFKVHGKGKDLFGDGFAIWYAKDKMEEGPVFGSKDYFSGLAIIVDTYSNHNGPHNHQHPYISAMVNNGTLHYDHDRDGTHIQLAGCEVKIRNFNHDTHLAVRYEGDTITVFTDFENKAAWKECLSVGGVSLPTGYHFGITASTGDLSDNHDIMSFKFYELDNTQVKGDRSNIIPSAASFDAPRERVEDSHGGRSGLKLFFIGLMITVVAVLVVIVAAFAYQKHKEKTRKRFY